MPREHNQLSKKLEFTIFLINASESVKNALILH